MEYNHLSSMHRWMGLGLGICAKDSSETGSIFFQEEIHMTKLPLKKSEGHFIITLGGEDYIIDTGSPVSISFNGQSKVEIGDRRFNVKPLPLKNVGDKISELVHMPIAGLIGLDIMESLGCIEISEGEGYVRFGGETTVGCGDYAFPFEVNKGVLTADLKVNGNDIKVILDTGARIDYMDPSILDTSLAVSHERDYNPIIGSFEVDGYEATYAIGDRMIDTVSYAATEELKAYVSQLGIHDISGVVGLNGFLEGMKSLVIDFRSRKVVLNA